MRHMLTPINRGGLGMSSHEITEWMVYLKIVAEEKKGAQSGTTVEMPRTMRGN